MKRLNSNLFAHSEPKILANSPPLGVFTRIYCCTILCSKYYSRGLSLEALVVTITLGTRVFYHVHWPGTQVVFPALISVLIFMALLLCVVTMTDEVRSIDNFFGYLADHNAASGANVVSVPLQPLVSRYGSEWWAMLRFCPPYFPLRASAVNAS
jgi:hypothetical protein